jgi:peroxiredoxin Q/BCP
VKQKNAVVYGVNPGSAESHKKFVDKNRLEFPLLVDEGQRVAKLYRAHGLLVKRTVYLIDPEGVIRFGVRGMPSPLEILKHARG